MKTSTQKTYPQHHLNTHGSLIGLSSLFTSVMQLALLHLSKVIYAFYCQTTPICLHHIPIQHPPLLHLCTNHPHCLCQIVS